MATYSSLPKRKCSNYQRLEEIRSGKLRLEATDLNVTKAADALGITRPTLYAKMKKYGLETMTHLMSG
jgi:transcriptional regulator of acetoin/glycerol metabolism